VQGIHEIVGIVSFALTLSQPVFAVLRNGLPSCSEDKRHHCHHVWHFIHAVTGYSAFGCAAVAVFLGIAEYSYKDEWPTLFIAGYGTSMGALVIFSIIGFIRACTMRSQVSLRDIVVLCRLAPCCRAPCRLAPCLDDLFLNMPNCGAHVVFSML